MHVMSSSAAAGGVTIIVGLNAALQKRFVLAPDAALVPGDVHRASKMTVGLGGKGQDVATTLACLDYAAPLELAQFVGTGPEGDLVYKMIKDMMTDDIDEEEEEGGNDQHNDGDADEHDDGEREHASSTTSSSSSALPLTVRTLSPMRTCTSIVASDTTTELVEPSGSIQTTEMQELMDKIAGVSTVGALCFMGSVPPGCDDSTYARIYEHAATNANTLCLIDSVVGLNPLLQRIAQTRGDADQCCGPVILKVNASELCRLAAIRKKTNESGGVNTEELVEAVIGFLEQRSPYACKALTAIAVTDGSHPAYLAAMPIDDEDEFRLFQIPICDLAELPRESEQRATGLWGIASSLWSGSSSGRNKNGRNNPSEHGTLFPIGAGDAVAAGTLAAWKSLSVDPAVDTAQCIHPDIRAALYGNEGPAIRVILTSFALGLACGSASCLQEENSVVNIEDVLSLFQKDGRPMFHSSHKLSIPG